MFTSIRTPFLILGIVAVVTGTSLRFANAEEVFDFGPNKTGEYQSSPSKAMKGQVKSRITPEQTFTGCNDLNPRSPLYGCEIGGE